VGTDVLLEAVEQVLYEHHPEHDEATTIRYPCLSTAFRERKLRQTTTARTPVKTPRWWPDLTQGASTKHRAVRSPT
jgi:hypothetical protein